MARKHVLLNICHTCDLTCHVSSTVCTTLIMLHYSPAWFCTYIIKIQYPIQENVTWSSLFRQICIKLDYDDTWNKENNSEQNMFPCSTTFRTHKSTNYLHATYSVVRFETFWSESAPDTEGALNSRVLQLSEVTVQFWARSVSNCETFSSVISQLEHLLGVVLLTNSQFNGCKNFETVSPASFKLLFHCWESTT